jgi:hypothetical protein
MAFIVGVDRRRGQAAFGLRICDILEIGLLIPRKLETWHGRDGVTLAHERASQQGIQTSA